jgi:hypothetical protein
VDLPTAAIFQQRAPKACQDIAHVHVPLARYVERFSDGEIM